MKDSKKKILIVSGIIAIVIAIIAFIGIGSGSFGTNNNQTNEKDDTEYPGSFPVSQVDETISDKELNKIEDYMNSYDSVGFVKMINNSNYNEDGTRNFSRDLYVVSEVNLLTGKDNTVDYLTGSDTYEELMDFQKIFGVEAKKYYEPFALANDVVKNAGINNEFTEASLNKEIYSITGQKNYIFDNDSEIFNDLIADLDYDEILGKEGCFTVTDTLSGNSYINFVSATITYTKDNTTYEKNLSLVIQVWNEDGSNPVEDVFYDFEEE